MFQTDFFSSVLAASEGASIVSQNNDLGSINAQAALLDERELGKMYSAEQIFQMRNDPSRQKEAVKAAITRASLDATNGRIRAMFAKKPAWHGLGTVVDKAATSAEAIRFAGLDWQVAKVPLFHEWNGKRFENKDTFAIVRTDTGDTLGTVGSRYAPVQNAEGFEFLDGVLREFGARYETAGSIYGGKRVWMLAAMPERRFEVQAGDEVEPFVMFSNCHDGSGAAWCFPTTVRVECANTHRIAMNGKAKALSIRHTGNVKDKIDAARKVMGFAVKSFDGFQEAAQQMVVAKTEIGHYANDVLDTVLEVSQADCRLGADLLAAALDVTVAERDLAAKSFQRKIERRGEVLVDILNRYESERCSPRGSVWAAYNAVSEHADHGKMQRQSRDIDTRRSQRFESVLTGEADTMKQAAYVAAANLL